MLISIDTKWLPEKKEDNVWVDPFGAMNNIAFIFPMVLKFSWDIGKCILALPLHIADLVKTFIMGVSRMMSAINRALKNLPRMLEDFGKLWTSTKAVFAAVKHSMSKLAAGEIALPDAISEIALAVIQVIPIAISIMLMLWDLGDVVMIVLELALELYTKARGYEHRIITYGYMSIHMSILW